MPTSIPEYSESHSTTRYHNDNEEANNLILASNEISDHHHGVTTTTAQCELDINSTSPLADIAIDTNDTADSSVVLTKIFRSDTENTARSSLLEDFLQLVEPSKSNDDDDDDGTCHPPLHVSSSMDTVTVNLDDHLVQQQSPATKLHTSESVSSSTAIISDTADPRLLRIKPDQLKPLATLFTEFYEAQATSDTDMLPQYKQAVEAMHSIPVESRQALTEVLNDIDRLAVITGDAFADQRVTLSNNKQEEMAAIELAKRIIRLSKRMDSQRVELRGTRQSALVELTDAIERSGQQMADQRVAIDNALDRRMQLARVTALVEKMDRTRLTDQDWLNPQLQREDDISRITQQLQRTPSAYIRQRYTMSGQKQRDMFIDGIMTRIRRLDELRMSDQDAEMPRIWQQRHQKRYSMSDYEAIEQIVSSAPERFEDQRASRKSTASTRTNSRGSNLASSTEITPSNSGGTPRKGHRSVQSLDIRRRLSNAAEFFRAK
ncbi:hypothetical protein BDF22DRAFT_679286 [Syncephalis plumigaleata]|nr:hypothetical protein BDF22DRAFT_679286 [Syncephalis plumigaleata]